MTEPSGGTESRSSTQAGPMVLILSATLTLVVIAGIAIAAIMFVGPAASIESAPPSIPDSGVESPIPSTATPTDETTPPVTSSAVNGVVIPDCPSIRTPLIQNGLVSGRLIESSDTAPSNFAGLLPGPVAIAAMSAAQQGVQCVWTVADNPAADAETLTMVEIGEPEWQAFSEALVGAGWAPAEVNGAQGWTHRWLEEEYGGRTHIWTYVYVSGVWISDGAVASPEQISLAVDAIRAANS